MLKMTSRSTDFQLNDANPTFDIIYAYDTALLSNIFEKLNIATEELQCALVNGE